MAEQQSKLEDELDKQPPIQTWAPLVAGGIIVIAIMFYAWHFRGGLSADQGTWGEFGDFIGGLVNPIIGFFTICLLAVSLRQNHRALSQANKALEQSHKALEQSKKELELTREAIEDARKMQAATEQALRDQTDIAASARDMNNAIMLLEHTNSQHKALINGYFSQSEKFRDSDEGKELLGHTEYLQDNGRKLAVVLGIEISRLINKHYPR